MLRQILKQTKFIFSGKEKYRLLTSFPLLNGPLVSNFKPFFILISNIWNEVGLFTKNLGMIPIVGYQDFGHRVLTYPANIIIAEGMLSLVPSRIELWLWAM